MKKFLIGTSCVLFCLAGNAMAQDACQAFVGQKITTTTFDSVVSTLSKVPAEKSEYETTAAYEARLAAVNSTVPKQFIIQYQLNKEYLKYDADAGKLNVAAYAFRNINTDYSSVFGYGTPFYGKVKYDSYGNIDVVLSQTEKPVGQYEASNAYGAKATVTKVARTTQAVYERNADYDDDAFVGQVKGVGAQIGALPISVDEAKALKATATAALVIEPKWPYFAKGQKSWDPTISNPTEITDDISVVVADIKCALLLNGSMQAVAAFSIK